MKNLLLVLGSVLFIMSNNIVHAGSLFDGYWFSDEHKYAFKIKDKIGIATLSNSSEYAPGDPMLRMKYTDGSSFKGEQIFTDGKWYAVEGQLLNNNELRLVGGGYIWMMIRR